MHVALSVKRFAIGAAAAALVAAGCTAGGTPAPSGATKIHLSLTPSHVSAAIAVDMGFIKGLDVSYDLVQYGNDSQLFHAGTDPIGNESPWEAAFYQTSAAAPGASADYTTGKKVVWFGTAEATNFNSGIIIRAEDASKYKTLQDLKGQKVGIPGFDSGTWAAFQTVAKGLSNIDPKTYYQIVEGDPGALEGLLQKKSIDAMITFTAPTIHAINNPAYKMIYPIGQIWHDQKGAYLPINGWEADITWLDAHQQQAKDFIAGVEQGRQYLKDHPELKRTGGKYQNFSDGEGVLTDDATLAEYEKEVKADTFYLPASMYTQKWADAVYQFIQLGKGILLDTVPAEKDIFYAPTMFQ